MTTGSPSILDSGVNQRINIYVTVRRQAVWAAWVVQRFSAACSSGRDPGVLGSSPKSGFLHEACFSLCLSLSVSLINK